MITVDTDRLKQFESDLKTFAERAYPFATKFTVNSAAFEARARVQAGMRKNMILRNKFTLNSVRVETTRTLKVSRQEAVMGTVAPYMEDQEFGATKTKGGKVGVSIPTTTASGEGRGAQPRRRVARGANKQSKIRLRHSQVKATTKKQAIFIKIKLAAESGIKYTFLDFEHHPGIYKITGGKKRPKINLIHDMSKKSVRIPRLPIFAPATIATQKRIPSIYEQALIFQLKRRGLFKD